MKKKLRYIIYFCLILCLFISGYLFRNSNLENLIKNHYKSFLISIATKTRNHRRLAETINPKSIEIILTQNNLDILNNQRDFAYKVGTRYSSDPRFTGYVEGLMVSEKDTMKIKLRLKGLFEDHYRDPLKCSYKIKIMDEGNFMGMKKFAIQHPFTRGYMNEWYLHKFLEYINIIHLRYEFINVTINGRNSGIYAIEENMHKNLIENNKLKEGPICRFIVEGEGPIFYHDISPYNNKRLKADDKLLSQYEYAKRMLIEFRNGTKKTSEIFDYKKMAKAYALCDLLGHHHATHPFNLKFYFNPVTGLIEPIIYDNQFINPIEIEGLLGKLKSVEAPIKNKGEIKYKNDPFSERLFNDIVFFKSYIHYLLKYCDYNWLNDFFKTYNKEALNQNKIIWKSYPEYEFLNKYTIIENQKKIKKLLSTYISPDIKDNSLIKYNEEKMFLIRNKNQLPIEIISVSINGQKQTNINYLLQPYFLNELPNFEPIKINDPLDKIVHTCDSIYCPKVEVVLKYRYIGTTDTAISNYNLNLISITNTDSTLTTTPIINKCSKYSDFKLKKTDTNIIEIKKGVHSFRSDLVIPKGYIVKINPGAIINLENEAKIISQSPIIANGTIDDSVKIYSKNSTGQGIFILNTKKESTFKYCRFYNLSNLKDNVWILSGAINFYQADVSLNNCLFENNVKGDDVLNIMNSSFILKECVFQNILSDGFDGDFTKGEIVNCKFNNIGNDAIDFSGSNVVIDSCKISNVYDKALSAGENSIIKINHLDFNQCEIAITAKDNSIIEGENINVTCTNIALCAFQKKSQFGPAVISLKNYLSKKIKENYIIEEGSMLKLNDNLNLANSNKVKELLYGNVYGVKTKK